MQEKIKAILAKRKSKCQSIGKLFEKTDNNLYKEILASNQDTPYFVEKLWRIFYGVTTVKICENCKVNVTKFCNFYEGYARFCSKRCSHSFPDNNEKRQITKRNNAKINGSILSRKINKILAKLIVAQNMCITKRLLIELCKKNASLKLDEPEYKKIKDELISNTAFLDANATTENRIYCYVHNIKESPKCVQCGNLTIYSCFRYGYSNYCSGSCRMKYTNVTEKLKKTKLKKYGDANYNGMEKNKQTKLQKYGDAYYSNAKKASETKSKHTPEKKIHTKNKRIETNIQKYGVSYALQRKEIKEQLKKTVKSKYGVDSPLQLDITKERSRQTRFKQSFARLSIFSHSIIPMFTFEDWKGTGRGELKYDWKCVKCGREFKAGYDDGKMPRCLKCFPAYHGSQNAIRDYIQRILNISDEEIVSNRRKFLDNEYELDIYVPAKGIAIEYNGIYWHAYSHDENATKHLDKLNVCIEKNIRLIQIFEDEWYNKRRIVKNMLSDVYGCLKFKLDANDCEVKEVDIEHKTPFLEKYHLLGVDESYISLGLFYKNRLVAIMTFDMLGDTYILSRYAFIGNFNIIGGISKLLQYFEEQYNPSKLYVSVDKRWSEGDEFIELGFVLDHVNAPAYQYVLKIGRWYRDDQFKPCIDQYEVSTLEWNNMQKSGYDKIYDCGSSVFIKRYS